MTERQGLATLTHDERSGYVNWDSGEICSGMLGCDSNRERGKEIDKQTNEQTNRKMPVSETEVFCLPQVGSHVCCTDMVVLNEILFSSIAPGIFVA